MALHDEKLVISDISTGYSGRKIIENLSLPAILPGQVVSLIGPNAAGKTTLLRSLAGLQQAHGSVQLGHRELLSLPLADHARHVTYMPQSLPQRVALSVLEAVIGAVRASPVSDSLESDQAVLERAMDVIERVGIGHLAMSGLDSLSGGQRQLASLAQALVRSPQVLLLDEPISALDLHYQLRVMKLVRDLAREMGMIILMVLHDLTIAARWSDRIVVLSGGKVAADGPPAEAVTDRVLADVYRVSGRVSPQNAGLHIDIDDILPL
ncbi:ABC transporter ATP-binding protein [Altericroceibacterium spongiae]|uniref:ABC transporter ATP-binding protein n=1 Tax=Altericroceibacterium spongiae TaxID=2320269 RepID=A0A420EA95_9SPHN|nr:ABC transporter ATP-binding protein [Altericroceibacterium spongiae]RKF17599.1 ABC transporter ATP-binding protein [Altericroceibacterium spongiae]